jgi:hypothetical protein
MARSILLPLPFPTRGPRDTSAARSAADQTAPHPVQQRLPLLDILCGAAGRQVENAHAMGGGLHIHSAYRAGGPPPAGRCLRGSVPAPPAARVRASTRMATMATKASCLRISFSSNSDRGSCRVARMSKIEGCSGTITRRTSFSTCPASCRAGRPACRARRGWCPSAAAPAGRARSPRSNVRQRRRAQLEPFARGLLAVDVAQHDAHALRGRNSRRGWSPASICRRRPWDWRSGRIPSGLGQQYGRAGGLARDEVDLRLRRVLQRIGLVDFDLHLAAGDHVEQFAGNRQQVACAARCR